MCVRVDTHAFCFVKDLQKTKGNQNASLLLNLAATGRLGEAAVCISALTCRGGKSGAQAWVGSRVFCRPQLPGHGEYQTGFLKGSE